MHKAAFAKIEYTTWKKTQFCFKVDLEVNFNLSSLRKLS
jgi:hypothetical protein